MMKFLKRPLLISSGLVLLLIQAEAQVSGPKGSLPLCTKEVLRLIDADNARMDQRTFALQDNELLYTTALKQPAIATDLAYYRKSWLEPNGFDGTVSLGYETGSCAGPICEKQMQKVNHHFLFSGKPGRPLKFGRRNFIGFSMNVIDAQPQKSPILFQIWQGSPHGPPMSGRLITERDGSLSLIIAILNNRTGSNPSAKNIEVGRVRGIKLGEWYSFILMAHPQHTIADPKSTANTLSLLWRPSFSRAGFVEAFAYKGVWGYNPADPSPCVYARKCDVTKPNEYLDFKFGIYREAENSQLKVYFDNIKITTTDKSANPEVSCRMK